MPHRVLCVANGFVENAPDSLPPEARALLEEADELYVVTPVLTSRLQWLVSDSDRATVEADARLERILEDMASLGFAARGSAGEEDQLVAIDDALRRFDADAIVFVIHAPGRGNWHERTVMERARERFGRPVFGFLIDADGRVLDRLDA